MLEICSANEASIAISSAINSHREVWEKIDNIENYILRSQKPFNEEARKQAGFDWSANFNYGKGKAKIEQSVSKNVQSAAATLAFTEVFFNSYDEKKHKEKVYSFLFDSYLQNKFSLAIANVFIDTLEHDPNFYYWLSKIEYNAFTFGYCAVTGDNFTYLGHANHVRSIAFPDRTKISKVREWILFDVIKAEDIYHLIQDHLNDDYDHIVPREGKEYDQYKDGWIKEGLIEVFHKYAGSKLKKDSVELRDFNAMEFNWENIERFVNKEGVYSTLSNISNVFIAKIYNYDRDNNLIETYIVTDTDQSTKGIIEVGVNQYLLFKKKHGHTVQSEIINIIREYSVNSNDFLQELRGAGKLIAEDSIRFDVKKCRLEDKLLISNAPILKESNSIEGENTKIAVVAGFNILSEGVNIDPTQLRFDLSPHIQSMQMDEQNFGRETFHLDPGLQLSNRPTTAEVQQRSGEVSKQTQSKIPIKISDYSCLFFNVLKKLVTGTFTDLEVKGIQNFFFDELKKELVNEDVTKEDIIKIVKEISYLKLNPVNTDVAAIKEAMAMAESSEARERLMRMYFLAIGFSRRDVNNIITVQDYGTQVSIASFENAGFYDTAEIAFGLDQDHITHLNIHFAKVDRVIKGVSGGEDPVRAFNFLTNCLTNTSQHVDAIKKSPFYKSKYKEFAGIQKFFEGKTRELASIVERMKQQAQQQIQEGQQAQGQPQLTPEEQNKINIDNYKAMDKIKRTNQLTEAGMQRKQAEFNLKMQMQQQESQSNMSMQKELAELKKDLALLQSSAKLAK